MVIVEILTQDNSIDYIHRVSFVNEMAEFFFHNFEQDMFISIEGKLMPQLMNKNIPNSPIFFDIRCVQCSPVVQHTADLISEPVQPVSEEISGHYENPAPNMVCSPSIPVTTNSAYSTNQFAGQMGGGTDFNSFGMGDSSIEYLNGAPIDKELPFYPETRHHQ